MAKKVTERVIEIDAKGAENSIRALREEVRKLTEVQKDLDMESEEFRDISSELTAAQTKLRNAVQGNTAAVEGSYKAYSHQLQVLKEHRKWLAEGTEEYRKATEEISKLDQKLKDMDAEIGVYSRNVGNYASAFEGLNGGVQQVAQGIPQLVNGSENLFGIVRSSIPTIIKSAEAIGEVSAEGNTASSVIKSLAKSVFSWQTALVAAIAILAEFGDEIMDAIGKMIGFKEETEEVEKVITASEKAAQAYHNALLQENESASQLIVTFHLLRMRWEEVGDTMSEKEQFIMDNISAFHQLGVEINSVAEAEKLFANQGALFMASIKARIKAAALEETAMEIYREILAGEADMRNLHSQGVRAYYIAEYDKKKVQPLREQYDMYISQVMEAQNELERILNKAGIKDSEGGENKGGGTTTPRSGSAKKRLTVDNAISTLGAYSNRGIGISALGGLAINESASIEANKARLAALTQMEGASAEERKAIEQSLQEELAFIEQMRLETHEMVLNEMLRSDELTADERIALEEELTANQVVQAELRAKAAEEQAKVEKKAAEEVMAIEKKKDDLKQQILKNSSSMLKDFASTLEDDTAEYKSIQSAAVVIDTIAAGMAGYKQGMTYGGPAAPFLAAFNLATAIATGAAQLHALWAVKPDGSNADSALSSAQVPNVASSMPASYTRNLMGDNELSELNKDTRVYVVEQDITDTQKKAKTREESASF